MLGDVVRGDVGGQSTIIADGYTLTVPSVMFVPAPYSSSTEGQPEYRIEVPNTDFNLGSFDLVSHRIPWAL
jgi:hypothetical protein